MDSKYLFEYLIILFFSFRHQDSPLREESSTPRAKKKAVKKSQPYHSVVERTRVQEEEIEQRPIKSRQPTPDPEPSESDSELSADENF